MITLPWLVATLMFAAGSVSSAVIGDRLWTESESEVRAWLRLPLFWLGLLYLATCLALGVMTLVSAYETAASIVS